MAVRPLFLFSLPRSGSTLVQRVLAAHPEVATSAEPWILLPLVYARRERGVRAEYLHASAAQAARDFAAQLPGGYDDFDSAIAAFARQLYDRAAGPDAGYFLDKTPHYYLIAADILRIFPDAKVVFLWRNPLAVTASLIETFREGRFEPYNFRTDLYHGPRLLVDACRAAGERGFSVTYEELVGPAGEERWRALFEHLELDFDPGYLSSFREVQLAGNYQDPVGTTRYRSVTSEPLEKWRASLAGPIRKAWARRYLRRIAADLDGMGYELEALLAELDEAPGGAPSPAEAAQLALSWWRSALLAASMRLPESIGPLGDRYREDAGGVLDPLVSALRERGER